jgi:nicotinamidase/pyrazinamidase
VHQLLEQSHGYGKCDCSDLHPAPAAAEEARKELLAAGIPADDVEVTVRIDETGPVQGNFTVGDSPAVKGKTAYTHTYAPVAQDDVRDCQITVNRRRRGAGRAGGGDPRPAGGAGSGSGASALTGIQVCRAMSAIHLDKADALLIIDMQVDFLPGGALGVASGHEVVAPINHLIELFREQGLPIFASRDWHPATTVPSRPRADRGRRTAWPARRAPSSPPSWRCRTTPSSSPRPTPRRSTPIRPLPAPTWRRAAGARRGPGDRVRPGHRLLRAEHRDRCAGRGFDAIIVPEAMRAVDVEAGDGRRAMDRMVARGAVPVRLGEVGMTALSV